MELKFSRMDDPFLDWNPGDEHSLERDSQLGKDTTGQITAYAAAHLALQFRTFVYSVFICGQDDDLLRWDRCGAVVTEASPVQGSRLAEFFWRYHHLSPEARGVDVSVSVPLEEEAYNARQALKLPQDSTLVEITATDTDNDGTMAS